MKDLIGQNLGRYHIVESLGQGGMATVFKAYDTTLERYVAVKIIRTDIEDTVDGQFISRFKREAKALAQLDHPFILKVLDYGEQDGIPYLVMPFVPGGTLKTKMGHSLPYQQAASLLAPIARALEYAHKQQIIHRDVKPANILITEAGAPLLSDFGIAKMLASGGSTQLTATGVGIGTPDYMAPEQWAGQADPRTDIYSLGIVLYEMVTGHRPFTADTPAAVLVKHLRDPLPLPTSYVPDLPDGIVRILFKALDKEPENRFQDMGAFASALEKLAVGAEAEIPEPQENLKTVLSSSAGANAGTVIRPTQAAGTKLAEPEKKTDNKKFILIGIAAVVAIGIICVVLGGGAVLASLSLNNRGSNTPVSTIASTETSVPFPGVIATEGNNNDTGTTPFQSIEGFPDDVPLLTDNNGDLMKTTTQGQTIYMFSTNMSFEDVKAYYQKGMKDNGWTQQSETTQEGQTIWYYMKGDNARMVMVGVMENTDNNTRQVMIYIMSAQ